ncbi:MAG: Eco57I restriction-modification methylase domain-containing protein [Pirellulales bacterium]
MSKTFDQGKEEVEKLCRHFTTNRQAFFAPGVKEAHIRQMLIDPFFEALGWDVRSSAMVAPQYREVIPEDSLDVEGQQKAPDYTFRVGTLPKFYAEAKKCGVNIGADPAPAYQLRRYGWSAKLALSILTDFEELAVYDCTVRPKQSDKASHARVLHFDYTEYPDRWRELWDVFSREAVWSGAFDQYAASKRKRGTSEVDAEFLKEIELWRDTLARNIALRNEDLSSEDLNAAVQSTIDRVVFLRMAEDRGLEPCDQLLKLCERDEIYPRFMRDLCRRADEKYNSGLFHFQKESDVSEAPDRVTPKLAVDDKVFKPILQSLYFAHGSPYHFGLLPVEILGTVYERFLGKVIRLTAGHQAKVEEKPEVRKAGGVYYTPSYIVDYIVKQTVGQRIEGKSPAQLAGGKGKPPFRVLDMACGSGSFLLGAYQCLLDHCLAWYVEHKPETHNEAVYKAPRNGHWLLMIGEKKRILTAHVFGVDIDAQAVEVTKLSLLLKVLEGETDESVSRQQRLFRDRALPNLSDNIKCGNSLIGSDYFAGKLNLDPDEMKRVNPFDWERGFPEAIKAGGFDCVIGNPPYVRVRGFKELNPGQADYLEANYECATHVWDVYLLFFEKAVYLTKDAGSVSLIVPIQTLHQPNCRSLRGYLLKNTHLREVADLSSIRVFEGAIVKNCILTCDRAKQGDAMVGIRLPRTPDDLFAGAVRQWPQSKVKSNPGLSLKAELLSPVRDLCDRLGSRSWILKDLCYSTFGLRSCAKGKGQGGKERLVTSNPKAKRARLYLEGRDISRYAMCPTGRFISYLPEEMYSPRCPELFEGPKIVSRTMLSRPSLVATYDDRGFYVEQSLACVIPQGVLTEMQPKADLPLKFILGVLNSSVERFYFASYVIDQSLGGGLIHATPGSHDKLIVPKSAGDGVERMVSFVDSMLALHEHLAAAKSAARKALIQRQIDATDAKIDRLVYDLYGLTAEEIAIIEQATAG